MVKGYEGRSIVLVGDYQAASDEDLQTAVRTIERNYGVGCRMAFASDLDPETSAFEAARSGAEVVAAVGGDGTLNAVVSGVIRAERVSTCAVAVIPYGTGNDFASMCEIPIGDFVPALTIAAVAEPVAVDIGLANGRRFVNVASAGFGAAVTSETSPAVKDVLGRLAYLVTGLTRVSSIRTHACQVQAPDFDWSGNVWAVSIGNGRQAGGGFNVCPRAMLNDGLLDVAIIPEVDLERLIDWVKNLTLNVDLSENRGIRYVQVPWVNLFSDEPIQVNLDGEPLKERDLKFRIDAGMMRMCLPVGAPLL